MNWKFKLGFNKIWHKHWDSKIVHSLCKKVPNASYYWICARDGDYPEGQDKSWPFRSVAQVDETPDRHLEDGPSSC